MSGIREQPMLNYLNRKSAVSQAPAASTALSEVQEMEAVGGGRKRPSLWDSGGPPAQRRR